MYTINLSPTFSQQIIALETRSNLHRRMLSKLENDL